MRPRPNRPKEIPLNRIVYQSKVKPKFIIGDEEDEEDEVKGQSLSNEEVNIDNRKPDEVVIEMNIIDDNKDKVNNDKTKVKGGILSHLLNLHQLTTQFNKNQFSPPTTPKLRASDFNHSYTYFESLKNSNTLKLNNTTYSDGKLTSNSSFRSLTNFFGVTTPTNDSPHMNKIKLAQASIESILKRQNFILKLAKGFVSYGSPTHRLESNLMNIGKCLGLNTTFAALPNLLVITFNDELTHTSETLLLRVSFGYNMDKLDRLVKIYNQVIKDSISLDDALTNLDNIMDSPNVYPPFIEVLGYALGSFALSPLSFNGGWLDALISGLLGSIVGLTKYLSSHNEGYCNVMELTTAILVSLIASALHSYCSFWAVVIPAVFNLLPGLSLTIGMIELASRNVISGAVRIFYSLLVAFMLGFGLSLGSRLYLVFDPNTNLNLDFISTTSQISPYFNILLFPLASLSFNLFLISRPTQWPIMTLVGLIGYLVITFLPGLVQSNDLVLTLAGFLMGLSANLVAKFIPCLPIASLLSAIILIVPGSLAVKGSNALINGVSGGAEFAMQMIVIALSITVGLFLATLLVYPFGKKRSTLMTF